MPLLRLLLLVVASWASSADPLWDRVQEVRQDSGIEDPTPARRYLIRSLLESLVASAEEEIPSDTSARAAQADLTLEHQGDRVLLYTATDAADGFYAVRVGRAAAPLVLQAPHPWDDLHTGAIAAALFEQGAGRALLIATSRRNSPAGAGVADVTRRSRSAYQAATLGSADGIPNALFVQIHGFAEEKHGSWSCVLSDGSSRQPPGFLEEAERLLSPVLSRFGPLASRWEVPDLAGTLNVQGRGLAGRARFLHLELSRAARESLLVSAPLRGELAWALETLAACPEGIGGISLPHMHTSICTLE
ncbi:MAG: hypothetical protein JXB39_04435 [Deltaproteobacteria bacterium]|nr:hypothetical protein [Deltaproteobacteria bacterium]